jgi:Phosphotransferase enzyme family
MSDRPRHDIACLAAKFRMPGDYVSHAPCGQGHINDTYEVRVNQAGTPVRYILQRINHTIFTRPDLVMENIQRVTHHIAGKLHASNATDIYRRVLSLVPCLDGRLWHQDPLGNHWRAYLYVEGAEAHSHVNNTALAEEAARSFGRFQALLADLPLPRLADTIPNFHHTRSRYDALIAAAAENRAGRRDEIAADLDWCRAHESDVDTLLHAHAQGHLPERITHNDTKINNVMIDHHTGEGICVMDLDTVMPGLVLYDFGDLVRTTTISTAEDEQDTTLVQMRLPMFEALVRGYLSGARTFLTGPEIDHLAFSGKLITLETGLRFLTDYLNGDTYFKTRHPAHNLERFRVQAKLVESIERQQSAMEDIVAQARVSA